MTNTDTRFTVVAFNFLQNKLQYPLESIAVGQPGDEHFQVDISIIDPDTSRVLALIKLELSPVAERERLVVASNYRKFLERSHIKVPVYLFTSSERMRDDPAIFILTGEGQWEPIGVNEFPSLEKLIASNEAQQKIEIAKTRATRNEAVNELKLLSVLLFAFLLILFFVPWFGPTFSEHQLFILLGAVIILLMPSYTKIKVFGVELERSGSI